MKYKLTLLTSVIICSFSSTSQAEEKRKVIGNELYDPAYLKKNTGLSLAGDFLFWQAQEDGMAYAIKSSSASVIKGTVKSPHMHWRPGFRVAASYFLPHDKWELGLIYTRIHGHGSSHEKGILFPTWSGGKPVSQAKSDLSIHLNWFNLELGRNLYASSWLSIRPHIGLTGGWIQQNNDILYGAQKLDMHEQFWGVGIRAGAQTLWGLGGGFGLYGNGAVSLADGRFNISQKLKSLFNIKNNFSSMITIGELSIGVRWDRNFQERYHLGVKAGFEFNVFSDQNQFTGFQRTGGNTRFLFTEDGNLSFQGLSLGLRFDF